MTQKKPAFKFAVCINNDDYEASLELHKIYRVLPDEDAETDGDVRVVDESGEDYLYPAEWFVFIELPHALEESFKSKEFGLDKVSTTCGSGWVNDEYAILH